MTFFLIILVPFLLMLLVFNPERSTDVIKNIKRAVILFEIFLVLDLFMLKQILGIDSTFVEHRINPSFLSLRAIVFSCVFALILGGLAKFMTNHFALIFKKGVRDEE